MLTLTNFFRKPIRTIIITLRKLSEDNKTVEDGKIILGQHELSEDSMNDPKIPNWFYPRII